MKRIAKRSLLSSSIEKNNKDMSIVEKPVLIASLRETSILFGVLFSVWLHKESLGVRRFCLAFLMLIGIVFLKIFYLEQLLTSQIQTRMF